MKKIAFSNRYGNSSYCWSFADKNSVDDASIAAECEITAHVDRPSKAAS